MKRWLRRHPWTCVYVMVVSTVVLMLQTFTVWRVW